MSIQWVEVPEERFEEMLGMLPPAVMTGLGFLVGEPMSHGRCSVSGVVRANYSAFAKIGGKSYEARASLTVPEFKKLTAEQILAGVIEGGKP